MVARPADSEQISFGQELLRKGTHMGALIIPGGYYLLALSRLQMVWIMGTAALLMILIDVARLRNWWFWRKIARHAIQPMVRKHEVDGDFTGATYILLSVVATVAMFDKPIAIAALAFIIVGDTFAALIGRKFGRHKFGRKSIEGSLGCLLGTLIVACLTPQLSLAVGVAGAFVATVVEALSTKIDDNVSVPILSGLFMSLLTKIVGA
ncbi:MAG: phosphatidate cytidylyltransferase [candidate division Zixibacteria bacterium]|nr:phosphatidate cytidylyltransferase [candidate division Zixibacteria bacterium]